MSRKEGTIRWKPVLMAALIAILFHLQLLLSDVLPGMYRFWNSLFPKPPLESATEVTLVSMTPRQFEQNRQVLERTEVQKEEREEEELVRAPEEEKKPDDLQGQVVDVAPTADDSPPKDARFLSEHNTNVKKESVSRHRRPDYGVAQPRPTVANDTRRRPDQPQEEEGRDRIAMVTRKRGEQQPAGEEGRAFEIPDIRMREALKLKLDMASGELATWSSSDEVQGNSKRLNVQMGPAGKAQEAQAGERGEHDKTVALFKQPSLDQLDMVSGAPANDHIEDVAKGEDTLLNSREFKYATFFNRVKRGVSQHWSPRVSEEYMRRDPYGNIYGVRDRHTLLSVSLDAKGELMDVSVSRSSGVKFFDDVAMQSFREASPFPNPPAGLVDAQGLISFQFGFYFMIGERPTMRAFQFQRPPY